MALVKVANVGDIKEGEAKTVFANDEAIALYKVGEKFYATTNTCPHKGGPLGEGFVEDGAIVCPWHGWRFNVDTGVSPVMPSVKIQTYSVVVQGNDVMIEI